MPLQFEGLSYGADKSAVIFDIGAAYTKAGFAGETGPRCIIPSVSSSIRAGEPWRSPIQICSADNGEKLFSTLVDFFHVLYFKKLLVNPKERRVVVVESVLCTSEFRTVLAKVLFNHFEVLSVLLVPAHLVALLPLGTQTGLVIDIGYREALVLPVVDGLPLLNAWSAAPLAAKAVHANLKTLLLGTNLTECDGTTKPLKEIEKVDEILTTALLEDITVRACFVTTVERADKLSRGGDAAAAVEPPQGAEYPLKDGRILHLPGSLREQAAEVMFQMDNDQENVATLLLQSLLHSPVDTRRQLAGSVVLLGGCTMLPGFRARLQAEVLRMLTEVEAYTPLHSCEFKFHKTPAHANYSAWHGAAIMGALEVLSVRSVTREAYHQSSGKLADWCDWHGREETTTDHRSLGLK